MYLKHTLTGFRLALLYVTYLGVKSLQNSNSVNMLNENCCAVIKAPCPVKTLALRSGDKPWFNDKRRRAKLEIGSLSCVVQQWLLTELALACWGIRSLSEIHWTFPWRVIMSSFTNFDVLCNLDECGRIDSLGMFPLLFNNKADILVLKHSFTFWQLIRQGSCPKCWRTANATPISKCAPSPSVSNYLPIYITPLLSKLLEIFIYPTKKILWEGNDFHC